MAGLSATSPAAQQPANTSSPLLLPGIRRCLQAQHCRNKGRQRQEQDFQPQVFRHFRRKENKLLAASIRRVGGTEICTETKGETELDQTCPCLLLSCKHQESFSELVPSPSGVIFSYHHGHIVHAVTPCPAHWDKLTSTKRFLVKTDLICILPTPAAFIKDKTKLQADLEKQRPPKKGS